VRDDLEGIKKNYKKRAYIQAVVFSVLLLVLVGWGIMHERAEVRKLTADQYPLIDPARQFIDQKDFIVNLQPLRQYLNDLVAKEGSDVIQIYYEQLNTGANININQDLRLAPASLAKLPLAISVVHKIETNKWTWDNELILTQEDIDEASGDLYKNPVGTTFTIERLISEMLINSDNTAYSILKRNLSPEDLQPLIDETGLEDLYDQQGEITAKEYTRILRSLYTSSFLQRKDSQKILLLMSQSTFHDYLSQGIPANVPFAHKYGENQHLKVLADSGIVYVPNRPYAITVIIKPPDSSIQGRQKGVDLMKQISKTIYDYSSSTAN